MRTIIATTHKDGQGTLTKDALDEINTRDRGRQSPLYPKYPLADTPVGSVTMLNGVYQLADGCWAIYAELTLRDEKTPVPGVSIAYTGSSGMRNAAVTVDGVFVTADPSDPHCNFAKPMSVQDLVKSSISRIHPKVHWDRGVVHADTIFLYGWIDRERDDPRRDYLLLQFGRLNGYVEWWSTSSKRWSLHFHDLFDGPGVTHVDCIPYDQALAAFDPVATA